VQENSAKNSKKASVKKKEEAEERDGTEGFDWSTYFVWARTFFGSSFISFFLSWQIKLKIIKIIINSDQEQEKQFIKKTKIATMKVHPSWRRRRRKWELKKSEKTAFWKRNHFSYNLHCYENIYSMRLHEDEKNARKRITQTRESPLKRGKNRTKFLNKFLQSFYEKSEKCPRWVFLGTSPRKSRIPDKFGVFPALSFRFFFSFKKICSAAQKDFIFNCFWIIFSW